MRGRQGAREIFSWSPGRLVALSQTGQAFPNEGDDLVGYHGRLAVKAHDVLHARRPADPGQRVNVWVYAYKQVAWEEGKREGTLTATVQDNGRQVSLEAFGLETLMDGAFALGFRVQDVPGSWHVAYG